MLALPLSLALLAAAPVPTNDNAPLSPLCDSAETPVLTGRVDDDFGFDLGVCLAQGSQDDARSIIIRWEGEGGGSSISCGGKDCQGRIEYARHTSPHLTILTLGWIADGKKQILTQTLSRDRMDAEPQVSATHRWYPAGQSWIDAQAEGNVAFPVITRDDPLALMAVERVLSARPGNHALFGEAQR